MESSENCKELYSLIGGAGISILFLISELMPFLTKVKSNGVIHAIINTLKKNNDEAEPLL